MAEHVGRFTPDDRAALLAQAEAARARAAELIAQALLIQAQLVEQLDRGASVSDEATVVRDELRSAVAEHARAARALGDSPETVVLQIKSTTADAVAAAYSQASAILPLQERLLREDLVSWTIQAYFGQAT
jgi:hypothetical protein